MNRQLRIRFVIASLLMLGFSTAQAASGEALQECTTLSGAQQVSRFGSQYVLVRDGESYYRLRADHCDKLALATKLEIRAQSLSGVICPSGTQIKTNTGDCTASSAERIDESTYRRYQRRR